MNPTRHRTRVAVVDSHEVAVLGLRALIEDVPGFTFVGSAATVDEHLASGRDADLVILDLDTPDGSHPSENVAKLTAAGARVLIFTGPHPYLLRLAATTDVLGVIRKTEPTGTLHAALTGDHTGTPFTPTVQLSRREEEVFRLFADGLKARAVSAELGLSEATVDDYLRRIRRKYAAAGRPMSTRTDLHKRALEDGLLPYPGTPHAL